MISRLLLVFVTVASLGVSTSAEAGQRLFYQVTGSLTSDFDNDGAVGFGDFLVFVNRFGSVVGEATFEVRFDLDTNGIVNFSDFLLFADSFGTTSTPPLTTPDLALYVLDPGTSSIEVYNFKNHLAQSFLPFRNPGSFKISADHERMYVYEQFGLFVLNDAHQVLFSVPGTASGQLVLHPDETFAYAAEITNDLIRVIDLNAQAVVDTIAVGNRPGKMAVSQDGRWLYVANASDISVVDLNQNTEVLRLDIDGSLNAIVIDPTGSRAYYSVTNRATVGVLDVGTNTIVGEIQLEGDDVNDIKLSPDGSRLYVNTTRALVELNVSRNLVVRSLEFAAGTSTIGITPDGLFAYVGSLEPLIFDPVVAVINLTQWRLIGRIRGFTFPAEIGFRRTSFDVTESDASQQLP
jgi:DNA-binding beta-propeller fold protein YncE